MKNNLASKLIASTAIAGLTLLAITASPLRADNLSRNATSPTNYPPCWRINPSSQMYRQRQYPIAQSGSMMNRGWHRGSDWGYRGQYHRMYNPNTVETISGEVISIDSFTPMRGMSRGVHLQLKTGNEILDVHLGPSWYIDNQDIKIQPKDTITVKGSRITFAGKPALISSEIKKDDATLVLRDANGIPYWSGWR